MTNEQIKAIIDNAPEKATHVDINGHYWHNSSAFYWLCCDDGSTCAGDVGNSARKLADLREILDLRERVGKAERERNEILKAVYDWQDCDTASQSKRAQIEMYEIVKRLRGKTRGR